MFTFCESLETVPHFNTSKVKSMRWMFGECMSLKSVPHFNVKKVDDMVSIFYNCNNLNDKTLEYFSQNS
jgi:surface protein